MDEINTLRWRDPSSHRCIASRTPSGIEVSLPNKAKLLINDDYFPIDWNPSFTTDNASTRLWHRSMTYLPRIAELPDGRLIVARILTDFLDFIRGSEAAIRVPSMDHALAIQIRVLIDLIGTSNACKSITDSVPLVSIELLPHLLSAARMPGVRVPNNHGIMLSTSLMLAATLHPELTSDSDSESDAEIALEHIHFIFDQDGMSHENTASYQGLYVKLLEELCEIAESSPRFRKLSDDFRRSYDAAATAYCRLLLPDGSVPPLGDGGMGQEPRYAPTTGRLSSPHNGLYVNSGNDAYIAITCGARSPVHKQMDDTSILMWSHGKLLVLDGGVQNYDAANLAAVRIRTQPGHSGLFFKRFDDRPLKFFNSSDNGTGRRVEASMQVVQSGASDTIEARYSLEDHHAHRRILVASPTSVTVTDRTWKPDDSPAVARFLLSGDLRLSHAPGRIEGTDGDAWIRLTFEISRKYELSYGEVSWSLAERTRCWVLEFSVPGGGRPEDLHIETGPENFRTIS